MSQALASSARAVRRSSARTAPLVLRLLRERLGWVGAAKVLASLGVARARGEPFGRLGPPASERERLTRVQAADLVLLHRALVNVLLNATQHKGPRGKVRVDTLRTAPNEICLRVFNDGAHLPAEVRERVFDPFFTTRAHGTGLGLAVVRRTLDDLGGRVEVSTEVDGVAVSMYLPAA